VIRAAAVVALAPALLLVACDLATGEDGEPQTRSAAVAADSLALVDTVAWEGSGARVGRVVVYHAGGEDTIPDLLTAEPPVLVGDTVVHGFAYYGPLVTEGFRYRVGSGQVEWLQPPDEHFVRIGSDPTVSPDGRFLAWVANGERRSARAAVARWPSGEIVYLGDPVAVVCGGAWSHRVTWTDVRTFEITIDRCVPPEARFVRLRGTVEVADEGRR
jgi:hypothetical protein